MRPLIHVLPEDDYPAAAAVLRELQAGAYIVRRSDVELATGIPAIVALAPRAFESLDGWPSESPAELYEQLLAAISAEADATGDPTRKRRLQKFGETSASSASRRRAKCWQGLCWERTERPCPGTCPELRESERT
jgi:hypothetical protein